MIRKFASVVLIAIGFAGVAEAADPETERDVKALYHRFVEAQNARNLNQVRATLLNSPEFVWISDGKPFWGPDALIERMSAFQKADVWTVTPDYARAKVVEVSPISAFLYQPLRLTLGSRSDPRNIDFLVNILCQRTAEGWRVAALFTTEENPN